MTKRNEAKFRFLAAGLKLALVASLALGVSGCLEPGTGNFSSSNSASTNITSIPAGAMAARVVFTTNSTTGSFNAPTNAGPPAIPGQGLPVIRLFNPDGTTLASAATDPNWPVWISSIEIGITGPSSGYSLPGGAGPYTSNPNCARFATANEAPGGASQAVCGFGGASPVACGAPAGTFRVSEADCNFGGDGNSKGVGIGNGAGADNVYIRANFNRAALGAKENILMVVNYAA